MKTELKQKKFAGNFVKSTGALENPYKSMSIEEIRQSKPKSRLESFLRRKALQEK